MSTSSPGVVGGPAGSLHLRNELDKSRSPYVRAHMNNPVAWQMWNEETLALAKKHDRLLFVSIGYAACHWCHVMERESFESPVVAQILNSHFIPIKIDREERPDIDRVYMNYVQASTGRGGWPMSVFLTPDLEPVFGGTYFPGPDTEMAKAGATSFLDLVKRIQMIWETQRERCLMSARSVTSQLKEFAEVGTAKSSTLDGEDAGLELELLEEAYNHFARKFDPEFGGFGGAPKFPTPSNLSFLLSLGASPDEVKDVVGYDECERAKQMVLKTLRCMTRGGINDQIGHGFARYSVTRDWSLPHFEKMLYDQPQLLSLYLDAFLLTGDAETLSTVYSLSSYLTSPPLHAPTGGFFSSEDADSLPTHSAASKKEGGFYVWTRAEFSTVLESQRDADILAAFYGVEEEGNVDPKHDAHDELVGQNVLQITRSPEQLSASFGLPTEEIVKVLKEGKAKLLAYRVKERPAPDLDDKIVAGWNGLAIGALARTSSVLETIDDAKAKECRDAAIKAVEFLKRELFDPATGEMKRVYREGPGDAPAFADDYAYVIQGLIELYEATFDDAYLEWADVLQTTQIRLFHDPPGGGFFSTALPQSTASSPAPKSDILLRLKDTHDGAEPSTNGISASNLHRLSSFFADAFYARIARSTVAAFAAELDEHPFLFGSLLGSVVWGTEGVGGREVTVFGEGGGEGEGGVDVELAVKVLRARLKINTTVVRVGGGAKSKWLEGRNPLVKGVRGAEGEGGRGMVQVCERGVCRVVGIRELETEF